MQVEKVYIIIGSDLGAEYGDQIRIFGVFSSMEKAEQAVSQLEKEKPGWEIWSEDYVLDQIFGR